jgi:hypothetical protein
MKFSLQQTSIILFFLLSTYNCINNNRVSAWEITTRVQPLIDLKANQCGNRPDVPLWFTAERTTNDVEACEQAMIGLSCPFNKYPWACIRIF